MQTVCITVAESQTARRELTHGKICPAHHPDVLDRVTQITTEIRPSNHKYVPFLFPYVHANNCTLGPVHFTHSQQLCHYRICSAASGGSWTGSDGRAQIHQTSPALTFRSWVHLHTYFPCRSGDRQSHTTFMTLRKRVSCSLSACV